MSALCFSICSRDFFFSLFDSLKNENEFYGVSIAFVDFIVEKHLTFASDMQYI